MLTVESALRKDRTTGVNDGMQHRHFACVAASISALPPKQRKTIALHFAAHLACTNARFDRRRFLAASGIES